MTQWMLYVASKRQKRTNWRAAKEALAALRMVGVGPGVKMSSQSLTMKDDMVDDVSRGRY